MNLVCWLVYVTTNQPYLSMKLDTYTQYIFLYLRNRNGIIKV